MKLAAAFLISLVSAQPAITQDEASCPTCGGNDAAACSGGINIASCGVSAGVQVDTNTGADGGFGNPDFTRNLNAFNHAGNDADIIMACQVTSVRQNGNIVGLSSGCMTKRSCFANREANFVTGSSDQLMLNNCIGTDQSGSKRAMYLTKTCVECFEATRNGAGGISAIAANGDFSGASGGTATFANVFDAGNMATRAAGGLFVAF